MSDLQAWVGRERRRREVLSLGDGARLAAVLDRGTVVHSGTARSLLDQPELLDRLLGVAR